MKSIGELIKDARIAKKISYEKLGEETKIKKEFILAVEKSDWSSLPEYPIVAGFVKSMADFLGIDPAKATAVLRRDYPPKVVSLNPKPDVGNKFVWGPKRTFVLGVLIVIMMISSYLGYQYYRFVSPPKLEVAQPLQNQVVSSVQIKVVGRVDQDATVKVNNQPVIVDKEGLFSTDLPVNKETNEVIIIAKSRAGKETSVTRKIKVELGQ